MSITIERLNLNHIDGLERIENECFSEPWSRNALQELLSCDYAVYLVAMLDGSIAGYIGMYTSFDVGAINNIGVLSAFRRKGVGEKLLAALCEYSKENGITTLTLEVRRSNAAAIALYEKFGFRMVAERKNYYKKPAEDALLYNLDL